MAGLASEIAQRESEHVEDRHPAPQLPTIVPAPEERHLPFPLTDIQQAYWTGRTGFLELGHVSTHHYIEIESVDLDLERLSVAWQQLIDRHEMLRTIVLPDGQQQILKQTPTYEIEVLDSSGQDPETIKANLEAVRQRMSHQVLPSDQWPLFEIRGTRLDAQRVRLHFSFDMLILDMWSRFILFREWAQLYQNPKTSLPSLDLSFRDYVLAESALRNSELYRKSQQYWWSRLPTLPPAAKLPLAKDPSMVTRPLFVRHNALLEPETWVRLKNRASRRGLTPSGALLAAFAEVLKVWSKSPRFTVNLTLFNRLPLHPQVNDIVGDFTSVTLLAVENSAQDTFEARARCLQQQLWKINDQAAVNYVPKPYPGRIIQFVPTKQYACYDGPGLGWDNLALGGVELYKLPVYPAGMLVEPFVRILADKLRACTNRAVKQESSE